MTILRALALVVAIVTCLVIGHCWHSSAKSGDPAGVPGKEGDEGSAPKGEAADEDHHEPATCRVRVVALKRGVLEKSVVAYGTLAVSARGSHSLSVPIEVVVRTVRVPLGTSVVADTVVCDVGLTPDSQSARKEAIAARDAAKAALAQAQERLGLHLATAADVQQAQQALALAEPKAAMWADHPDEVIEVRAGAAGVVTKLDAQAGKVFPPGTALAEIAGGEREIHLGCEPSDATRLAPNMPVQVSAPRRPDLPAVTGHVLAVSGSISPETRLQEVIVQFESGADQAVNALPLGELLVGKMQVAMPESWIVPREALVADEQPAIFTVADGKAVRHQVTVVGAVAHECAIAADDLTADGRVIVQGSYEVEAGMAVSVESGP